MKLVVCMKRVPDSAAKIRVADDGNSIDKSGVYLIISPYDAIALERAVQIKEATEGATVTVVCLGPAEATKEIRSALAMGADEAVHIKDAGGSRGPYGIAKILADTLQGREFDAVLFGKQSIDSDNCAVGIMVAQILGLPVVSLVTKLEIADGKASVEREAEGGTEVVEVALPAVFTAQRGLAEPRYPSIKGIMKAKKKPIEEVDAPEPSGALVVNALAPPPERQAGKIVGDPAELAQLLRSEAKVI